MVDPLPQLTKNELQELNRQVGLCFAFAGFSTLKRLQFLTKEL